MNLRMKYRVRTKIKSEGDPPRVINCPNLPSDTRVRISLVTRLMLKTTAQICAGANTVYSCAERVCILEKYFASKSCAALREAYSNAYPDKKKRTEYDYKTPSFKKISGHRKCL
jgi:hypothetical protein